MLREERKEKNEQMLKLLLWGFAFSVPTFAPKLSFNNELKVLYVDMVLDKRRT